MQTPPKTLPRIALQSIAAGLLLMAFFTSMWAGVATGALGNLLVFGIFGIFILLFIAYGIYFFIVAPKLPRIDNEADREEGKKMGMWYGIIFGLEGITIPLATFLVVHFSGQERLILPVIALVVGLHFFPMARVFNRTIDYYLATFTTVLALSAIVCTVKNLLNPTLIILSLGVGVALVTTAYGLYMIREGYRMTQGVR